jgi:hypothetical protein
MLRTPIIRSVIALSVLAVLALVGRMSDGDDSGYGYGMGDAAAEAATADAWDDALEAVDAADLPPVDIEGALDEFVADGLGLPGTEAGNSYEQAVHGVDTHGDDVELDALWDACADGDDAACDELYLESPIGSAYEAFGDSCGGREANGAWCEQE